MPNEELKERNVEHVLQTAYRLFLANGIENTTKSMLVRASRISRSSIDRYFASKEDCVLQTAEWIGVNIRDKRFSETSLLANKQQTGLDALRAYMEAVRDLMYEKPELFVLGVECRAYVYRNCTDEDTVIKRLRHTLGSSEALRQIFVRGMQDGSMNRAPDASHEAILTRESFLGFLASIAITRSPSLKEKRPLVDSYISRILKLYSRSGKCI